MTRTAALVSATLALMLVTAPLGAQSGAGWASLFDGRTLNGWNMVGDANWSVANGEIQATSGTGFLVTPRAYGDFQMTLEFWADEDANSGVFIRCADAAKITDMSCYEVNIFDKRPDPTYRTGGIVHTAKPASMVNAAGRWNTYDVTARGNQLTVILNGMTMVDAAGDRNLARGPIALQRGAGTIKFRNVRIREL